MKNLFVLMIFVFALISTGSVFGQKKKDKKNKKQAENPVTNNQENDLKMQNEKDSLSYAIGMNIGENILQQGLDMNPELLAQGVMDSYMKNPKMDPQQAVALIQAWQAEQQKAQAGRAAAAAEANKKEGAAFLAENANKEGVVVHESGLQYKILKEGTGNSPTVEDTVTLHYRGTLLNGQEFDSSISRGEPITFALKQLIRGWQIAVPLMKEGGEIEIYVPSELGYGPQGAGQMIGPNATLIFFIQLLSIESSN